VRTVVSRAWLSFVAWSVIGALLVLGFVSILSIGVILLAVAVGATALLLRLGSNSTIGMTGLISGAALPVAYIGWANREGPGNICHAIPGGMRCDQEWNPTPFWVVAAVLFAAGIALFIVHVRSTDRP
jgi:hypothetical protein